MAESIDETTRADATPRRVSRVRLLAWVVFFALAFALWTTYNYYRTGFFETQYYAAAFAALIGLAVFSLFIAFRKPTDHAVRQTAVGSESEAAETTSSSFTKDPGSRPNEMVRRVNTHPTSRGAVVRVEYELDGLTATDYRIEAGGRRWGLEALETQLDDIFLPVTRTPDASNGTDAVDALRNLGGEMEAAE